MATKPKIMVVDDQPVNVQLLKRKLEREGMDVISTARGALALQMAVDELPDLILLDVMMPDMNGFEVCHRLKQSVATRSIPIIFITARTSKESKLEGLSVGAVDYITKPIDLDETLARVQTQLRFLAMNRELLGLQRRLSEARRSAAIGAITQGISHNLNNLLGVVIGHLDLIKAYHTKPEQVKKNADAIDSAVTRIVAIIRQLNQVAIKTRFSIGTTPIAKIIDDAVRRFQTENHVQELVQIENTLGDLEFNTNIEVMEEAIAKLLINAWECYGVDHTGARPIRIVTGYRDEYDGKKIEIRIIDHGPGIDPKIRDHMFEPFTSTKHTVGVGMGLTVARHSVRALGGNVDIEENADGGVSAVITHPLEIQPVS